MRFAGNTSRVSRCPALQILYKYSSPQTDRNSDATPCLLLQSPRTHHARSSFVVFSRVWQGSTSSSGRSLPNGANRTGSTCAKGFITLRGREGRVVLLSSTRPPSNCTCICLPESLPAGCCDCEPTYIC
ncbi:hypothetical protein PVAP13_5KG374600 [Panicum virgatum]|uniref:Uncharacterized protein n=1 Tax=Panicum virgatum TaxID=38727 RepID=A0A8T0SGN2_PANVG|nr:hypothetical protein PVAP13_5KG374600 [Panicum virgatum]